MRLDFEPIVNKFACCGLTFPRSSFIAAIFFLAFFKSGPPDGISFKFKKHDIHLANPMRRGNTIYHPRATLSDQSLDTLSNWFDPKAKHVEIIRQDDSRRPTLGLAIAFEFDEENGEYPYTPTYAAIQLKDFGWGGIEFDLRDTMNYTGVSNNVSNDLTLEILGFQKDTIFGRFSGLLISGSGGMTAIDEGQFRVRLRRIK